MDLISKKILEKLVSKTLKGKLVWRAINKNTRNKMIPVEGVVTHAYYTGIKTGENLVVGRIEYQKYDVEYGVEVPAVDMFVSFHDWEMTEKYTVRDSEFNDERCGILYELFQIVKIKVNKVENVVDFLNSDEF